MPAGGAPAALLRWLGGELDRRFATAHALGPPLELRDEWWDAAQGRFRSTALVDALLVRSEGAGGEGEGAWMLAVADADLCAAGAPRVFGEATVGGPCAVVALAQLRAGTEDERVFRARLLTSAVHELGHLAGAEHCADAQCVMYPSADIADTDRKGDRFCEGCRRAVLRGLGEANA